MNCRITIVVILGLLTAAGCAGSSGAARLRSLQGVEAPDSQQESQQESQQDPQQDPQPDLWRDDPAAVVDGYLEQAGLEPVDVLLLGTFHFDDQGLDAYKPTHSFDPLTARRQAEIERVVEALVEFAPDVVCIERRPSGQVRVDEHYAAYRAGDRTRSKSEIDQVAYRLAARLGHERVHAIDAPGRWLEPRVDPLRWAREHGALRRLATPLEGVVARANRDRDRFIDRVDLTTILRFMNHPRVLQTSHAAYLVGGFHAGDGEEYPGPDGFVSQWFNRNLRIFSNLARATEPGQRVVVLIGAGHVPILRHCVASSPEFRLVEVRDVLPAAKD